MLHSRPLARHRALRALAEGARPTLDILADATGRSLRMLKRQAEAEGWQLDRAPREDVAERIRAIAALLLDRVEAMGQAALEPGGSIDRAEIETITAMLRSLDKAEDIMRPQEVAQENQIKQDENLAQVLERINARILELAHEIAGEMVAGQYRPGGSLAGAR